MSTEELERIAVELYRLRPAEFTGARDAAVRRARSAGDRDLAADLRRLRRPAVAAWAVNLLVRQRRELVEQVVGLGDSLREAQTRLQGDALRELIRQRRQLVAAVVTETSTLAHAQGQRLSEAAARQVEQTLQAAMADPSVAAAVRSGLLTQPLSSTGVESLTGAVAVPVAARRDAGRERPSLSVVPDEGRRRREAEERLSRARAALEAATTAHEAQRLRRDTVQARLLQLEAELEELRGRIVRLESESDGEAERLAEIDEEVEEAAGALDEARRGLDAATRHFDGLH